MANIEEMSPKTGRMLKEDNSIINLADKIDAITGALPAEVATAAKQDTLAGIIGEKQDTPTAYTLLARVKSLEGKIDAINDILDAIVDGTAPAITQLAEGTELVGEVGIDQTADGTTNRVVAKISQTAGENLVSLSGSKVTDAVIDISEDAKVSTEIDFRNYKYLSFLMPAAWDTATLTIYGSATAGGTKVPIKNDVGQTFPLMTVAVDTIYTIDANALMIAGVQYLAFVSSADQTADRTIKVMLEQ